MLDIIIILIIVINMLVGYRKGFVATVLSLFIFVFAIILTRAFTPAFTEFLKTTPLYDMIVRWTADSISLGDGVNQMVTTAITNVQTEVIGRFNMPEWLMGFLNLDKIASSVDVGAVVDLKAIELMIATQITDFIIQMLSGIVLFFIFYIGLKVVAISINLITLLPIIHTLNKTVGTVAGLIRGVIIVWVLLIVFMLLFLRPDTVFAELYETSYLAIWLNERNILLSMLVGIIS